MNKVILMGKLGAKPETKWLNEIASVTTVTLATSNKFKNKNGEIVENTDWHNLKIWNKRGLILEQYADKGDQITVVGSIRYRSWDDKEGIKRYMTEIEVENFEFGAKAQNTAPQQQRQAPSAQQHQPPVDEYDDLPF